MLTDFLDRIHLDNSENLLPKLPSNSIDLVITSPPFYAEKVYTLDNGEPEFGWKDYQEYLNHLDTVLTQLLRLLKPGGKICFILSNTPILDKHETIEGLYPIVFDTYNLCIKYGFKLHTEVVWYKIDPSYMDGGDFPRVPNSQVNSFHDWILVMQKPGKIEKSGEYMTYKSVWNLPAAGPIDQYNNVYNSFPDELVKRCIELWSLENSIILDPYAGSGQVVRVALSNNRHAIGIEVDKRWVKLWDDIS